jgi:hypothetical protein
MHTNSPNSKTSDMLSINSINSDKVLKSLNHQLERNRPFRRKQEEQNHNKKKQTVDFGRIIKRSSFGSLDSVKG